MTSEELNLAKRAVGCLAIAVDGTVYNDVVRKLAPVFTAAEPEAEIERLKALVITAHVAGQECGHHDTVEGGFIGAPEEDAEQWLDDYNFDRAAEPRMSG